MLGELLAAALGAAVMAAVAWWRCRRGCRKVPLSPRVSELRRDVVWLPYSADEVVAGRGGPFGPSLAERSRLYGRTMPGSHVLVVTVPFDAVNDADALEHAVSVSRRLGIEDQPYVGRYLQKM